MRVLLVFPQTVHVMREGDNTLPPNAIFYLAAILRNHGHDVAVHVLPRPDLFDPGFVGELIADCDVLGLSANSINWRMLRGFALVARSLRQDLPIVLGGIHATIFDSHALDVTSADFVVRGEAEFALPELIEELGDGREFSRIGGLTYRDSSGEIHRNPGRSLLSTEHLMDQPAPAFDLMPEGEYHGIAIESSRGCAYNCVFCSIPFRQSFRALNADSFAARLETCLGLVESKLVSPFGKSSIYILDDCFTTNRRRVIEIFDRLRHLKDRVRYGIEARADQITPDMAEVMAENEFWLIQMGLESGYAEGLKNVNKGLKIEHIDRACEILKDHGLAQATDYAFIIGFPWEDKDDCLRTLEFATYLHLRYRGHISVSWYEPFPGSPLWEQGPEGPVPVTVETYDDPNFDWRSDPVLFRRIRPRLSWKDIEAIEGVIDSLAGIDPKYLLNFRYFSHDREPQQLAHRLAANQSL